MRKLSQTMCRYQNCSCSVSQTTDLTEDDVARQEKNRESTKIILDMMKKIGKNSL